MYLNLLIFVFEYLQKSRVKNLVVFKLIYFFAKYKHKKTNMKSLLFLMITALMFAGCSKDEDKDEFYEKQITANELESGTGTYVMNKGSYTYYLVFKNGGLGYYTYKGDKFTSIHFVDYSINKNNLNLVKHPYMEEVLGGEKEYYTLYISFVHWGHEKTTDNGTGGEQLLIRGDNYPYEFATGYYDKSSISLK